MCNPCLDTGLSRRRVVLSAAGLLAAAPLAGIAQAQPVAAADTPDAALNLLVEGNARYVANQPRERDFSAGRASRTQGQAPFAAILAGLRRDQGRHAEARDLLAPVYGWFTEGFNTPDLKEAKALLGELA